MSASVSRVVVRMPWNDNDEDVRRESTLRATRYATKVLQAAAVA